MQKEFTGENTKSHKFSAIAIAKAQLQLNVGGNTGKLEKKFSSLGQIFFYFGKLSSPGGWSPRICGGMHETLPRQHPAIPRSLGLADFATRHTYQTEHSTLSIWCSAPELGCP